MPFPMKIQPIDSFSDFQTQKEPIRNDSGKPVLKSRLKRLFDRPFPNVLRISSAPEKPIIGEPQYNKDVASEFEPSSVCLAKMVQNFIEESNEKPSAKCGRNRCNCFNGNNNGSSDDEFDVFGSSGDLIPSGDAGEILKSLIPCTSAIERNLLADTAAIIDKNKVCKRKDDLRKIVTDCLSTIGYDASICKSRWDKSPSYPAGEYEYIDAIVEGERLLIDIDFRSEFEIARSTSNYKALLHSLPYIFVGKPDRLQQIVSIVSEAAKQSLTKKGMHFPPWRKAEYIRAKWLSTYTRSTPPPSPSSPPPPPAPPSSSPNDAVQETENKSEEKDPSPTTETELGEFGLIFIEKLTPSETNSGNWSELSPPGNSFEDEMKTPVMSTWKPPAIKPKSCERGTKVVTGLASLLKEKP